MIPEDGLILNINKPIGWTSFDVVRLVRYHFQVKKVGHSGTLDPFANGVLLICVGKATKKVPSLMELKKEYTGVVSLDFETDTLDVTGRIVKRNNFKPGIDRIESKLNEFVGEIDQVPPKYSALKKDGRPLYKLVRAGKDVEPEPRKVVIEKISLLEYDWPLASIKVVCGKGTYIRALARDLGEKLNSCAYLKTLTRTKIGPYKVEDSIDIAQLDKIHFS